MRVLLFAGLAEDLGQRTLELDAPAPRTVAELRARLAERAPRLAAADVRVAVNQRYARDEDALDESDEIALIPPVSGG